MKYESPVIKATVEERDRESCGYKLLKSDIIQCANCGKKLLSIIKIKDNEERHRLKAGCAYCNDESFWYHIDGKICVQPLDGLSMDEMSTKVQNEINFTTIKVIKNER